MKTSRQRVARQVPLLQIARMTRGPGMHRRWSWTGALLALLAAALWGLAPVGTKVVLRGFSPELLAFVRLAAAAVLFRLMAGERAQWFVADIWVWLAGIGLGMDFVLYNYGLQRTEANIAGLVINIEMISTIAFAVCLLGERLSLRRLLGSAVTMAGVLVVTLDGLQVSDLTGDGRTIGNLLVMAAGISWSLFAVAQRRAGYGGNLFQRLTPIFSVAALTTAPILLRETAWSFTGGIKPVSMLIVLTVFGTNVVYWIYARAQDFIDISLLAILLCTMPIFTVLFAFAFLDELVTMRLLIGGAIIISGIAVIAMERSIVPEGTGAQANVALNDSQSPGEP